MPRRRAPVIHRHPFGVVSWVSPATPSDATPYAAVEAELQALRGPDALTGHAGRYALTLPSGVVVVVMADTDEESRIAAAILGGAAR